MGMCFFQRTDHTSGRGADACAPPSPARARAASHAAHAPRSRPGAPPRARRAAQAGQFWHRGRGAETAWGAADPCSSLCRPPRLLRATGPASRLAHSTSLGGAARRAWGRGSQQRRRTRGRARAPKPRDHNGGPPRERLPASVENARAPPPPRVLPVASGTVLRAKATHHGGKVLSVSRAGGKRRRGVRRERATAVVFCFTLRRCFSGAWRVWAARAHFCPGLHCAAMWPHTARVRWRRRIGEGARGEAHQRFAHCP